jgi:hypothetical protein
MQKEMIIKVLYLICFASVIGCEYHYNSLPDTKQLVLFQAEYINHAWGYSHEGYIIDSSGYVRRYKLPKNWHFADSTGYISQSEMNENLLQLDTVSSIVRKGLLLKYFSMVSAASEGKLSKPVNRMFDAGATRYSGYLYNSETGKYKQVLIRQEGDWSIENTSPEANEIYTWLKNIYSSKD